MIAIGRTDAFSAGMDMIHLAACALHARIPDSDVVKKMDLRSVYGQAKRHAMQAITYTALAKFLSCKGESDRISLDEALLARWREHQVRAIRQTLRFDIEREDLIRFLEENGIWYAPMQGLILQNYYPKLGMRQMCDQDILIDPNRRRDVREYFKKNDYRVGMYGRVYHDTYFKDATTFEIHHNLFVDEKTDCHEQFNHYYQNVKEHLKKDDSSSFGYYFDYSDAYIHTTTHSYRHYASGGNGVRSLMDTYVYTNRLKELINWRYVIDAMDRLGIKDYEKVTRDLSDKLFDEACLAPEMLERSLSTEERILLAAFIDAGAYGSPTKSVEHQMRKLAASEQVRFGDKVKYFFGRVFPKMDFYRVHYPKSYRYKILIPFCWMHRIFRALSHDFGRLRKEWRTIRKIK